MTPFQHIGPDWVDRPWWGVLGWLMPLLMIGLIAALAVWAVARMTRDRPASIAGPIPPFASAGAVSPPAPGPDTALERARMRYAGGEIDREEFLQVSRDLGAASGPREEVPDA